MKLQRLRDAREGLRSVISTQLQRFDHNLTHAESTALMTILREMSETIKTYNEKIIQHNDTENIKAEIEASFEYSINLTLRLASKQERSSHISNITPQETVTVEPSQTEPQINQQIQHVYSSQNNIALPELNLPTFNGDISKWQSFWDFFETAVHSNPHLSNIERFSYLRSVLQDRAASAVDGFTLTNANYTAAVDILKSRYGRRHRIIAKHMKTLVDLPRPDNTLISLRQFTDMMEATIRGLEALGQAEDSYGSLLVPIVMEKLPTTIRQNLVRELGCRQWSLSEFRCGINRELDIMEASLPIQNLYQPNQSTALLVGTNSQESPKNSTQSKSTRKRYCAFCHGKHSTRNCRQVVNIKTRTDIIKQKNLCYNCLGHHQVSSCKSPINCQHCDKRHHTSICPTQTIQERVSRPDP